MTDEGVIQFRYELESGDSGIASLAFAELASWRSILRDLDLIGEHPERYGGYGYGNLSVRCDQQSAEDGFVITASQTSGSERLEREHLVRVCSTRFDEFRVEAVGTLPPSSEALTHAMLYAADDAVGAVFHVHSSVIWRQREALALATTAPDVAYGSPAMAAAVADLLRSFAQRPLLFATAGHEDGIFAVGTGAGDCGALLVSSLAEARALAHPGSSRPGEECP
ncbi:MAG: class II aldolase/adducin family protein [Halieaceae bacterium]|nr:class II aldolase/adducin family protein [Halieaceae bacterium]